MKVVQINAVYKTGSTGRITWELHNALLNSGNDSFVFTSEAFAVDKGVFIVGNRCDRLIHALGARITGKSGYFSIYATKRLVKKLIMINPDVIHLHNLHGNYINLPILFDYIHEYQPRVIVTLHDCWFYTGKCSHYTVDACERWRESCGKCPRLKKDIPSWFFDRTYELLSDKKRFFAGIDRLDIVGVSKWITKEAEKSFLGSIAHFSTIYNGIDLTLFHPIDAISVLRFKETHGIAGKKVILGVASGWCAAKGLNYFEFLAEKLPEEYIIVLVGDYLETVPRHKNMMIYGSTERAEELAFLYNSADVFFNASKEESFGKVSAEALACGTPVICFPTTANPELVDDGCGEIVSIDDSDALLQAVMKVINTNSPSIRQQCVLKAQKCFALDTNIDAYIRLYSQKI